MNRDYSVDLPKLESLTIGNRSFFNVEVLRLQGIKGKVFNYS